MRDSKPTRVLALALRCNHVASVSGFMHVDPDLDGWMDRWMDSWTDVL